MCVINLDECDCDCHGDMDVAHIMPCCEGRCEVCGSYILHDFARHMERHTLRLEEEDTNANT